VVAVRRNSALKIGATTVLGLLVFLAAAWLVWVPSPKEPAYELAGSWGGPGSGAGQFNEPTGIAVHKGEVYVSDARNARIQVYGVDGRFRRQFGTKGDGPGQLGRPMNLAIH
jgi:hypothetical protein